MFFGFLDGYDSERWLTHYYFETAIIYLAATSSALSFSKISTKHSTRRRRNGHVFFKVNLHQVHTTADSALLLNIVKKNKCTKQAGAGKTTKMRTEYNTNIRTANATKSNQQKITKTTKIHKFLLLIRNFAPILVALTHENQSVIFQFFRKHTIVMK